MFVATVLLALIWIFASGRAVVWAIDEDRRERDVMTVRELEEAWVDGP